MDFSIDQNLLGTIVVQKVGKDWLYNDPTGYGNCCTLEHGLLCWKSTSYISQREVALFQEATQWLFFTWLLLEDFKALQPPLTGHCADFSARSHHGNSKTTQVCIGWSEAFQSRLCKPVPGYILIIWGLSGNIEITDILKNTSETNRVLNISNWEEPTWLGGDSSSERLYHKPSARAMIFLLAIFYRLFKAKEKSTFVI